MTMSIEDIQQAIRDLPDDDFQRIHRWISDLAWEAWDKEIEADSKAGKLDFLKERALKAKKNGTLQDL